MGQKLGLALQQMQTMRNLPAYFYEQCKSRKILSIITKCHIQEELKSCNRCDRGWSTLKATRRRTMMLIFLQHITFPVAPLLVLQNRLIFRTVQNADRLL